MSLLKKIIFPLALLLILSCSNVVEKKSIPSDYTFSPPLHLVAQQRYYHSTIERNIRFDFVLQWDHSSEESRKFVIEASTLSSESGFIEIFEFPYIAADVVGGFSFSSVDRFLSIYTDLTYWFRVKATYDEGESEYSNVAQIRFQEEPPSQPTEFIAVFNGTSQINFSWDNGPFFPDQYVLIHSETPDFLITNTVSSFSGFEESYSLDIYSNLDKYHWYRLESFLLAYKSDKTSSQWIGTPVEVRYSPALPPAPNSLRVDASTQLLLGVMLIWNKPDDLILLSGYKIERSSLSPNLGYSVIAEISPLDSTYHDKSYNGSNTYYYRIYSFNDTGQSSYSSVLTLP